MAALPSTSHLPAAAGTLPHPDTAASRAHDQPPCLPAPSFYAHTFPSLHSGRYWTLLEEPHEEWQPEEDPLPSDCRYRRDLALLAAGDVKGAQAAKEALEQQQRQDAKLRGIH